MKTQLKAGASFEEILNRYVDRSAGSEECWPWIGAIDSRGYGNATVDGRQRKAHRVAWEEANGPIPDGRFICHHCDNPPCCNPLHLFAGTPGENMADMARKGRAGIRRGERHPMASLSDRQVEEIRNLRGSATQRELAQRFGVCRATISNIFTGRYRAT